MTQTRRKRFPWGTLLLKADMVQASSQIRYGYGDDEDEATRSTPFQAADARHSWPKAFSLVNRWLKSQSNPSKRKTLKRVGLALKKWVRGNPQGWEEYVIFMDGQEAGVERSKRQAQWKAGQLRAGLPRGGKGRVRIKKRRVGFVEGFRASNPSRVKGRKVKGGRAVTLKNMKTITITRHSNGAVSVRGIQLKGRKR